MSVEFQLAYTCPHEMIREPVRLGPDGVTLITSQTALSNGARVYMNGLEIPQEGLHSPAVLVAGSAGPYRVFDDARGLEVTYQGITKRLVLPIGSHKASDLAKELDKLFDEVVVTVNDGRLQLEDNFHRGIASSIKVSGTAAETVGFSGQRRANGREVAPPWSVGLRDSFLTVSYPRFAYPPKQRNNVRFEVSYFTEAHRCRRCMATRIENDFRVDTDGDLKLINKEDLLYQSCLKALLTERGSNIQHSWYGSNIMKMIGSKAVGGMASTIASEIRRVLDTHIGLQEQQANYQQVTMEERLYRVRDIQVRQHQNDPTTFMCEVVVQNYSGSPVRLTVVYTVPGANSMITSGGKVIKQMGSY
tara:strand:+ start:1720 stop:2802 length:1083 start_codon:yes stop_codon:yes gene_type:complete